MTKTRGNAARAAEKRDPGAAGRAWTAARVATLAIRVVVAGVPIVCLPAILDAFEVPKAALLRIGGWALAALGAGAWLRMRRERWGLLDAALLAWLGVELAATLASVAPPLSAIGDDNQREGLLTSLGLAGLFVGIRASRVPAAETRRLLALWIGAAVIASGYALLQAAHLDPFGWSHTATYGAEGLLRPFGTLGHATVLAPLTAGALAAALCLRPATRAQRGLRGAACVLCGLATLLTLARGGWLGGLAAVAVTMPLAAAARAGSRASLRAAGLGAAILVGVAILLAVLAVAGLPWAHNIVARAGELLSPASGSSRARLEIWRAALAMARARPWLGQGPATFDLRFAAFQPPAYWRAEWQGEPFHAHSIYLQALATRGILGVGAGALWVAGLVVAARRAWRSGGEARALTPALLAILVSFGVAGVFGALGIAGAVGVVATSALLATLGDPPSTARERLRPGRGARLAAAVAALLAVAIGAIEMVADRHAAIGFTALRDAAGGAPPGREAPPDPAVALQLGLDETSAAARIEPWRDTHAMRFAQGLIALAQAPGAPPGALDAAIAEARHAVALAPLGMRNWRALALALEPRGPTADEEAAWRRVHELAPCDATCLGLHARAELAWGRTAAALALARRAAALYPQDGGTLLLLSGSEGALGDGAAAAAALRRAVAADWHGDEAGRATAAALLDSLERHPLPAP